MTWPDVAAGSVGFGNLLKPGVVPVETDAQGKAQQLQRPL